MDHENKTLYRSRTDRMLGGVCAGLGDYFDLDPTIVRLLVVLFLVLGNVAAAIVYAVMWIVVPEEPTVESERGRSMSEESRLKPDAVPGPDAPPPPPPGAGVKPTSPMQPRESAESRAAPESRVAPPLPRSREAKAPEVSRRTSVWIGVALVFVGVALLVQMFVPAVRLWEFWPVTIIIAGLLIIFWRRS